MKGSLNTRRGDARGSGRRGPSARWTQKRARRQRIGAENTMVICSDGRLLGIFLWQRARKVAGKQDDLLSFAACRQGGKRQLHNGILGCFLNVAMAQHEVAHQSRPVRLPRNVVAWRDDKGFSSGLWRWVRVWVGAGSDSPPSCQWTSVLLRRLIVSSGWTGSRTGSLRPIMGRVGVPTRLSRNRH